MNGKDIKYFFDSLNQKSGKCFYPQEKCAGKPIRAHSIQNSNTLDLLHTNNHVYLIGPKFESNRKQVLDLKLVGRNEASTFLGLCEEHDRKLFEPIDKRPIDANNQEQLFLLAYRSMLKEYHVTFDGFNRIHQGYQHLVNSGYEPGTNMEKEIPYLRFLTKIIELTQYKENLDRFLIKKEFDFLKHETIVLPHKRATVSCSQLFSADSIDFKDDVLRIILNAIPLNTAETLVVFSATRDEVNHGRMYWDRCFSGDEYYQKYEVSKMIIRNCENFFLKPSFVNNWSDSKRKLILDYYCSAFERDEDVLNSVEYYLFDD